jgi:hypothetical protein
MTNISFSLSRFQITALSSITHQLPGHFLLEIRLIYVTNINKDNHDDLLGNFKQLEKNCCDLIEGTSSLSLSPITLVQS